MAEYLDGVKVNLKAGEEAGGTKDPRWVIIDRCEIAILKAVYGPCIDGKGRDDIRNAIIDAVHDAFREGATLAKDPLLNPGPSIFEAFKMGAEAQGNAILEELRAIRRAVEKMWPSPSRLHEEHLNNGRLYLGTCAICLRKEGV